MSVSLSSGAWVPLPVPRQCHGCKEHATNSQGTSCLACNWHASSLWGIQKFGSGFLQLVFRFHCYWSTGTDSDKSSKSSRLHDVRSAAGQSVVLRLLHLCGNRQGCIAMPCSDGKFDCCRGTCDFSPFWLAASHLFQGCLVGSGPGDGLLLWLLPSWVEPLRAVGLLASQMETASGSTFTRTSAQGCMQMRGARKSSCSTPF